MVVVRLNAAWRYVDILREVYGIFLSILKTYISNTLDLSIDRKTQLHMWNITEKERNEIYTNYLYHKIVNK